MTKTTKSTTKKATVKPAKKMGRPSKRSNALVDRVLKSVRDGKSLTKACRAEGIAPSTFLDWVEFDKQLCERYTRACEVRSELIFDEMLEIADDSSNDTMLTGKDNDIEIENKEWVNRSKLRIETRKWMLGKMKPKKYGDKVDSEESDYKDGKVEII